MTDFDNWYAWVQRTYPTYGLTPATAQRMYDDYYTCTCRSCMHRKATGLIPVRMGPACTSPIKQLDPMQYATSPTGAQAPALEHNAPAEE